jgi:hypothetical protein
MAVVRAGVPEAAVDGHRNSRAAQQDVGAPTAVPARHGPVDDEPRAAPGRQHGILKLHEERVHRAI